MDAAGRVPVAVSASRVVRGLAPQSSQVAFVGMLALTGVAVVVAIIAAYVAHLARGDARRAASAAERSAVAAEKQVAIEHDRRAEELSTLAGSTVPCGRR